VGYLELVAAKPIAATVGVATASVQDADDLYYDSARKRVYISGGEGYISVFQQDDTDHYKLLAKVHSAPGRTHGWVLREGQERIRPFLPCRSGSL
jgi:hypothetical protein